MKRHAYRIAQPARKRLKRSRIVNINAQNGSVQGTLRRQTGLGAARVSRRALAKIEKAVRAELEPVSLVIALARQVIDYYGFLVRNVITVQVTQPDDSTDPSKEVACRKQVAVRPEFESESLRNAVRECLYLVGSSILVVVEHY